MNYYITECEAVNCKKRTAGIKARDDLDALFESFGMKQIIIGSSDQNRDNGNIIKKIISHYNVKKQWEKKLSILQNGDSLVIQFPMIEHSLFLSSIFNKLIKKNVNIVLFIHDLELFRNIKNDHRSFKSRIRIYLEETKCIKNCKLIIHNSHMKDELLVHGLNKCKNILIDLQIFDYLIPDFASKSAGAIDKNLPIIIAGNLANNKSGYIYNLPSNTEFNLYGVNYSDTPKNNIHYHGSFEPADLPFELSGSFGLVWDGPSINTCESVFGEYLKINNPHKTSLYLASGIPVIIWENAALADYIKENKCGITIDSLNNINNAINSITNEDYLEMQKNAQTIGSKLRNGYYTRNALQNADVPI